MPLYEELRVVTEKAQADQMSDRERELAQQFEELKKQTKPRSEEIIKELTANARAKASEGKELAYVLLSPEDVKNWRPLEFWLDQWASVENVTIMFTGTDLAGVGKLKIFWQKPDYSRICD